MSNTYREHFAEPNRAVQYDASQYASGSYGDLVWQIEQAQLERFMQAFRATHPHINYLDFAAGTGRVISFMENKVDTATGIEISEGMLAIGRTKVRQANLICADITAPDAPIEGQYDLITAFRFILNAEPTLQLAAFKALAARLKDDSSRLVFNNHGNLLSVKAFLWPIHRLRHLNQTYMAEGNCMTHRQVRQLLQSVGLEIESIWGSGFLSPKVARLIGLGNVAGLEKRLATKPALSRFATNVTYVARRSGSHHR